MMRVACYTNSLSPHQLPLAREIAAQVGEGNFCYIYRDAITSERVRLGWGETKPPKWCKRGMDDSPELIAADILYCGGMRPFDLFERRLAAGKKTLYMTERWFKPPVGLLRLCHPRYFRYALRLRRLMESNHFVVLPIGIHAARDMAWLCGLLSGNWRCMFRAPELEFERRPGGRFFLAAKGATRARWRKTYCLDKMRMWGYFVEEGMAKRNDARKKTQINILWVGRLLKLKRVDTIIRAVVELCTHSLCSAQPEISLDIYGTGPEENRLKKMAARYSSRIHFHPPVPISEVRRLMRSYDIYVLSSNGSEGWGAVVSEALAEGMQVVGTHEAGASATVLPESHLFCSGDWRGLGKLLSVVHTLPREALDVWSVRQAAVNFMKIAQEDV